ncbi:MAG TPA: flagellar regulator YcgR PilZN domain-containing protein [Roseateles sp.]|nr:flagellar regulator YcgR PilZN domain-containing protein [Roseateles sp.]
MSTADTRPPAEFRIADSAEIEAWLRQLLTRQAQLQLSNPQGHTLLTRLWSLDSGHASLGLELVQADDPQLRALLDSAELMAVAYLDQVRLEFELEPPVLVQGPETVTLHAPWPHALYRFQRREAFRIQPLGAQYPRMQLKHPLAPDTPLQLRVLDLSVSGLALALPAPAPALTPGQLLSAVRVELDRERHFDADLRLQHVGSGDQVLRLGCAFARLPGGAERQLQLYIDQTQKRQRLLKKN